MASKPPTLCKLQKGLLLDAQEGFVDTFNWLVDFCANLKGEGEVVAGRKIFVDRHVSDKPVIKLNRSGSNGDDRFCFAYNEQTHQIESGYIRYGITNIPVAAYTVSSSGFYYIRVYRGVISSGAARAAIERFNYNSLVSYGVTDGEAAEVYIPLYQIDSSLKVAKDWRFIPYVQAWEDGV